MSYKLLLVDDEPFMLSYLRDCVPWKSMNVEIVASASNGEDAIEKTREYHPDLIITDIVMPNMHGLEFIKNIYGQYKSTKIIILSGHQNFEFAREALLYGVIDYIVKPSLVSDIVTSVSKAIAAIEQERAEKENYRTILSDLQHSLPDITRSFLEILLKEPVPDLTKQLREKGAILGFPVENCRYLCFQLVFDGLLPNKDSDAPRRETERLLRMLKELPCVSHVLLTHQRFHSSLGILDCTGANEAFVQKFFANTFMSSLPPQMSVTACLSAPFDHLENASSAFQQIQLTLNSRTCSLESRFLPIGKPEPSRENTCKLLPIDSFLTALRASSSSECSRLIHSWIETAIQKNVSMHSLRRELRSFLIDLDTLLASIKAGLSPLLWELGLTEAELPQEESLIRLEKLLNLLSQKIIARLSDCKSASYPPVIFLACQYIEEHYQEKITVADLASQLYLTPNYLSSLFKKHTGSSISEYITMCRIRRAKELMAESADIKTYEVADLVGYNDYEHFRKVFKKYVGINPARYRSEVILPRDSD